jgi:PTS system mannose-specific IID component
VRRSWLLWLFFCQANYNYERLQGHGVAHAMTPAIKRLYASREDRAAALKRHLTFFNCEPNVGGAIHGTTLAMEEQRANGAPIGDEAFNAVKTGLMGPLSGVGDRLSQGTLVPLLLTIGIGIAGAGTAGGGSGGMDRSVFAQPHGNVLGPIAYALLIVVPILGISYFCFTRGYRRGRALVTELFRSALPDRIVAAGTIVGNVLLGALAATYVTVLVGPAVHTGRGTVSVQRDVLDALMPGLLPLAVVLLTWYLLRRGVKSIRLVLAYVAVGLLGALPLFGPAPHHVGDRCGSSILAPYAPCPTTPATK